MNSGGVVRTDMNRITDKILWLEINVNTRCVDARIFLSARAEFTGLVFELWFV